MEREIYIKTSTSSQSSLSIDKKKKEEEKKKKVMFKGHYSSLIIRSRVITTGYFYILSTTWLSL